MTHARIVLHVLRWLVAARALLMAAEVAAGEQIKGRVVDPEGNSIKGAKVYLIQSDADYLEFLASSTNADEKGEFVFASVEEKTDRPGQLVAQAKGWGVGIS